MRLSEGSTVSDIRIQKDNPEFDSLTDLHARTMSLTLSLSASFDADVPWYSGRRN